MQSAENRLRLRQSRPLPEASSEGTNTMPFFAWMDSSVPILICPASQEIRFTSVPAIPIHHSLWHKKLRFGKKPKRSCFEKRGQSRQRPKRKPQITSRLLNGGLPAFLLPVAANNHKSQSKQAEDERVFFRFGDDVCVNPPAKTARRLGGEL